MYSQDIRILSFLSICVIKRHPPGFYFNSQGKLSHVNFCSMQKKGYVVFVEHFSINTLALPVFEIYIY